MEWQEYKKNHPSWNFGDKDPGRTDFEARALRAWRKVGPRFCKRYGTRFTEHGEASSSVNGPPTHWLLILDSSPSMVGEPWLGLKEAVKALLLKLEGAKQDRFTIIQFSGTAWIEMTYEANPIVQEAFESVAPRGGYTSFQAGLECARDAVLKLAERHTGRTTAVFMSDGCDGPRDGSKMSTSTMDDFRKALEEHSTDFQFHSIAYGGHADEAQLKIMADVVGGKFSKSEDEVELKSVATSGVCVRPAVEGTGDRVIRVLAFGKFNSRAKETGSVLTGRSQGLAHFVKPLPLFVPQAFVELAPLATA